MKQLSSYSKQLFDKIIKSDNPVQLLCDQFSKASGKEKNELRGILRELTQEGYINIQWAGNLPYIVNVNKSARTYYEQNFESETGNPITDNNHKMKSKIFISHRSTDKLIADMLVDFFVGTGIPKEAVFCSSLPGNDIAERISKEIKDALKSSVVNIAILSRDYYQSAFCLNEAGILWYQDDIPVIPIALPEINSNNMYGFLNNEYKLRRLDSDTDISHIYDIISEAVSAPQTKASVVTHENNKLREKYAAYLLNQNEVIPASIPSVSLATSEFTTDDEQIVLFCILQKNVRKVSKAVVADWLHKNELYDVNIDNAFDLLSSFEGGIVSNDTLEFGLEAFRKYSANASSLIPTLKECVDRHKKMAADTFKSLWASDALDEVIGLFIAYIIDERICSFGNRWRADAQIETIKQWEDKNSLDSLLSNSYSNCLQYLIQHNLVYESDWTIHGNPRNYSLCSSLQEFLFNCPTEYIEKLQIVKNKHIYSLPF